MSLAAIFATPLLPSLLTAQEASSGIRVEQVAERVYVLTGGQTEGNITAYVAPGGMLLVDAQWNAETPASIAALGRLSSAPVRYVVNTHLHPDHTFGNPAFRELGATIIAHSAARERLTRPIAIEHFGVAGLDAPRGAWADITFSDELVLNLDDETIRIIHPGPAHTDGDAMVFFERSNVLHMGDLLLTNFYPFIDRSNGGSARGLVAALDRAIALANERTIVVAGHGPKSDRSTLQQVRTLLATTIRRVEEHVAAGRTLEQVIASRPTSEFDARWDTPVFPAATLVTAIFRELKEGGR